MLLLLLALAAGAARAGWNVSHQVVLEHGELTIDHSKSVAEISKAQASGGFPADHGVGLFQNRIKTELSIESPNPALGGKSLLLTTRLSTRPVIYVAREFPKDSCAYGVILGHELQHQLFDLEVLRALPDEIQRISQDVFAVDALDWSMTKPGMEAMKARFFRRLSHLQENHAQHRHQRIDNPDSYRALSELCAGEIGRILAGNKG